MIDEALEEMASLYVLGLLEGPEATAFQARMRRDPALVALVKELSDASSELAYTAHSPAPSRDLKERLMDKVDTALRFRAQRHQKKTFTMPAWIPWTLAAAIALGAVWVGQLYFGLRAETITLNEQKRLAEIELASARNQLQAERLIVKHEVTSATDELSVAKRDLVTAHQQAEQAAIQLEAAQKLIAARDLQVAMANDQIAAANAKLAASNDRITAIESKARHDADFANFKISTLNSLLANSPQSLAIAVWNPARQEGVLRVEKLPTINDTQDYQLWFIDPEYTTPINGGVFTVDPETGEARFIFKPSKPIHSVAKFAVSLEKKGGVPKSEGPVVLISQ
jgi:anti-sigma-K factor RskA